jgi:hypothetical protein
MTDEDLVIDRRTSRIDEESLSPLEQAAEECCAVFDRLEPDDKRALAVPLVALGALHQGDLGYVDQVAELARVTVLEFLG